MEDEIENGKQIKNNTAEDVGIPPFPSPPPNPIEDTEVLEYMECCGKKTGHANSIGSETEMEKLWGQEKMGKMRQQGTIVG